MTYLFTIIVFLIIFSFLILIHELGHFVMAKRAGIKVEEFGLGLPPRIWGKKKGETLYSINWIPFGGFVRMYGEDSSDPKMLRSKRSFAGKSMRARVKVVIAGVVMNFFVAWILMVAGFTMGMQPLLVPDEIFDAVDRGDIVLEPGLIVKKVDEESYGSELGIEPGYKFYEFNGEKISEFNVDKIADNPEGEYVVIDHSGEKLNITVEEDVLGIRFYDFASFPRVKVFELSEDTMAYDAGMRQGDILLTVNGRQIYGVENLKRVTRNGAGLEYEVYRDGSVESFVVEEVASKGVIISDVIYSSPAMESGLESGDVVVSVNGERFSRSEDLVDFIIENSDRLLSFIVLRGDQTAFLRVTPDDDGRIGVLLSELYDYGAQEDITFYNVSLLSSVKEIKDEQYPFHVSLYKAFGETYKLSKFTVIMFGDFVGGLFKGEGVAETVAGPVGIAQMTHLFVQEGFIPILRFVAILSLSLAVINILPIPALDGGRLLFILIELIIGRRVPQKWETYIHAFGYILILLLILAVTYGDIMRIANG